MLIAAFALLVLGGCQRNNPKEGVSFTFTSEKPALEASTRTVWDGQGIQWSAGDAIAMTYSVDDAWSGSSFYNSDPISQGGSTARFTVSGILDGSGSGSYRFYTVYPSQAALDASDAPYVTVNVPAVQTPAQDSFDPSADLMVGVSEIYSSRPESTIPLRWYRVVAHGDITLTNLDIPQGESLVSITLHSQEGADLTGDYWLDIADEISPECFSPTDDNLTANSVVVLPDNLVLQGGSLHFWISVMPETLTGLTVTVDTDKARYMKSFSGFEKTFLQNARNILSISMSGAERTATSIGATGEYYVKLNSAPTDWTGDYLIVYESESLVLDGDGDQKTHAEVTISDGKIAYESGKAYNIRIDQSGSGYTMQLGNRYLGLDASKNALNLNESASSDGYKWTFRSVDGTLRAYNLGFSNRFLQYNASSHQFRCYENAQKEVQFFKLDGSAGGGGGDTPVTPTVTTAGASNITASSATLSATYTGNATYAGFQYGVQSVTENDRQAEYVGSSGSFSVLVEDLGDGLTYQYRAYIAVLEGNSYQYYYGDIRTFTTKSAGVLPEGDQPGWFEVPLMNTKKSGSYLVNANDANQYYAWHICAGGEKAANGIDARNYTVCFSAEDHCPLWIAAPRHAMYVGSASRTDAYGKDPKIPSGIQYSSKSTGGGCNKGHMLGSAERTSSTATNRQVFYYTNIAPQLSANFNTGGGRWNVLEDYVDTPVCADTLYEVLGCYFDTYTDAYGETQTPSKISFGGRNDVSMPTMFYYVLLRTKKGNSGKSVQNCTASELKCVAFVRSHVNKRQAVTATELMSVADLEAITGVTYFPNVPNAPKGSFSASDWGL